MGSNIGNFIVGRDWNAKSQFYCDIHLRIDLKDAAMAERLNEALQQARAARQKGMPSVKRILLAELKRKKRHNAGNLALLKAIRLK